MVALVLRRTLISGSDASDESLFVSELSVTSAPTSKIGRSSSSLELEVEESESGLMFECLNGADRTRRFGLVGSGQKGTGQGRISRLCTDFVGPVPSAAWITYTASFVGRASILYTLSHHSLTILCRPGG